MPERSTDNFERLASALKRMGAKLRTEAGPVEAPMDAAFIAAMPMMLNLVTDYGDLDLTFEPSGPRAGFEGWSEDASNVDIGNGLVVRVASLEAVIASKRAADRAKIIGRCRISNLYLTRSTALIDVVRAGHRLVTNCRALTASHGQQGKGRSLFRP